MKKIAVVILSLFIVECVVCCVLTLVGSPKNLQVNDPAPSEKPEGLVKSVAYRYYADENPEGYMPGNMVACLGKAFEPGVYIPAAQEIEEWSWIPSKDETQDPGWDLLFPIVENLDETKYTGPVKSLDGCKKVTTYYRVFGGLVTDEQLQIWWLDDGRILKFQKCNWGKYERLSQWEGRIASEYNLLITQARNAMAECGEYTPKDVLPEYTGSLFTDPEGRLVLQTTGSCWDAASGKSYYVQFYGAITPN